MAEKKGTRDIELRKAPRVAILRLAQQLREEARLSDDHVDAVVADLVSCAWLFDKRRTRDPRRKGHRAIELAARALLATIDGSDAAERVTPRSLQSPTAWWESLHQFAAARLERLHQFQSETPLRRNRGRRLIATAMVEYAIALVPGVDTDHGAAVARLLVRTDARMPKDADELARWTLTACDVPGIRTSAARSAGRQKTHRSREK